jgi:hypothetical protein
MNTMVKPRSARTALVVAGTSEQRSPIPPAATKRAPRARRVDLNSLQRCRSEMAHVYRAVRSGELDSQEGSRLVYILSQIGRMIESADLEQRLTLLEQRNE